MELFDSEKGGPAMIGIDDIKSNDAIKTYIKAADDSLRALGYTEHSFAHVTKVSENASHILSLLNYPAHDIELAAIAGYLHDIGNLVNRTDHSLTGGVLAFRILDRLGMPPEDIALIVTAIGNHDEGTGVPVNHIAAALILADKTDVRRTRVRNSDTATFDIHDRVNYSVEESKIELDGEILRLVLKIDTSIGSVMDYFEIFLTRMTMCRKAAEKLGLVFKLVINGQQLM